MPNDKLIDNKSFQNLEEGKITFAGMVRGGFSEDTEFAWQQEWKERAYPEQKDFK